MIDFQEYYYMVEAVGRINEQIDDGASAANRWNLVDLFNFYCYLKMKISIFTNLANLDKKCCGTLKETIATMADNLRVGNKTITKYLHQLEKLGMIEIVTYKNKINASSKSNEYYLSDMWEKYWDNIRNEEENV